MQLISVKHRNRGWLLLLAFFALGCGRQETARSGEVLLWHWMTDREDALQDLAEAYQKEAGVNVRLELYAPSDAYASRIRAAAQTNTLPDIYGVLGESRDFASYIKSGYVVNLQEAMHAEEQAWLKQFFPKALDNVTFAAGNHYGVPPGIYGVPFDMTSIQMLYNKDLFKQAGLDPERPPQTWSQWMDAWRTMKAAGVPGMVSGWGEPWMIDCFANNYAFNLMGEKKVLDTFRGRVPYTDPDWVRILELFEEIRKEGLLVPGTVTMINKTAEQTFANGKAAFAFNGSWSVNVYKGMNPNLSYAAMLPPRISSRFPMRIWGGASSFVVNTRSARQQEAIAFLKWFTAPAQQATLAKQTLNLPPSRLSLDALPPALAAFSKSLDSITHPSQWPVTEHPSVSEAFDKGIQSILIGEKTPAQVAADVQKLKERQRPAASSPR